MFEEDSTKVKWPHPKSRQPYGIRVPGRKLNSSTGGNQHLRRAEESFYVSVCLEVPSAGQPESSLKNLSPSVQPSRNQSKAATSQHLFPLSSRPYSRQFECPTKANKEEKGKNFDSFFSIQVLCLRAKAEINCLGLNVVRCLIAYSTQRAFCGMKLV